MPILRHGETVLLVRIAVRAALIRVRLRPAWIQNPPICQVEVTSGRPFIVNSGPSMGKEIQLPIGVELGRKFLRGVLSDAGYQRLLSTISGEHLRLHTMEDGSLGVEDLGSKNGTYLNGDRVVGPLPRPMEYGDVLNLHDLLFDAFHRRLLLVFIHHQQSGVSWKLLRLKSSKPSILAVGRNQSVEHHGTEWLNFTLLKIRINDDLDAISRRHFFMDLMLDGDGVGIQFCMNRQGTLRCADWYNVW